MKFCDPHLQKIPKTFSNEKRNNLILEFIDKMVDPIELQDKIDKRKNQCVVCFFRRDGTIQLNKMIKKSSKN